MAEKHIFQIGLKPPTRKKCDNFGKDNFRSSEVLWLQDLNSWQMFRLEGILLGQVSAV